MNLSIFQNIDSAKIVYEPFPHVVIYDALNEDLYNRLSKTFFENKSHRRSSQNNARVDLKSAYVIGNKNIDKIWKEFISYHVSFNFWQEIVNLFGKDINSLYPQLKKERKLSKFRTGVLSRKDVQTDIDLECQISMNTPCKKESSVRGPHVDNPSALYAGLLYMRDDKDDSKGGNLRLYKYKSEKYKFHGKSEVVDSFVEHWTEIPYEKNVLVFLINSFYAVHGVTSRSVTNFPRRFVSFISRMHKPLFDIERYR